MNTDHTDYTQPLGLDVGTSRIVVARNVNKKYQYETNSTHLSPCHIRL